MYMHFPSFASSDAAGASSQPDVVVKTRVLLYYVERALFRGPGREPFDLSL